MAFVYYVASSLDGFIADDENSLDWLFAVPTQDGPDPQDFMSSVGVQVMGSTTYRWLLDHEGFLEHPGTWQETFGAMPTRVFSTRSLPVPDGADVAIVAGSVGDLVDALRTLAGDRDVWVVGGGELAAQFLDAGALDRIEVTFAPVFLGSGAPLLPRSLPAERLRLREARHLGAFTCVVYDVMG